MLSRPTDMLCGDEVLRAPSPLLDDRVVEVGDPETAREGNISEYFGRRHEMQVSSVLSKVTTILGPKLTLVRNWPTGRIHDVRVLEQVY